MESVRRANHLTLDHSIPQLFLVAITPRRSDRESETQERCASRRSARRRRVHEAALADEHIATAITLAQAQVSE